MSHICGNIALLPPLGFGRAVLDDWPEAAVGLAGNFAFTKMLPCTSTCDKCWRSLSGYHASAMTTRAPGNKRAWNDCRKVHIVSFGTCEHQSLAKPASKSPSRAETSWALATTNRTRPSGYDFLRASTSVLSLMSVATMDFTSGARRCVHVPGPQASSSTSLP